MRFMATALVVCSSLACSRPEVGAFVPNHPWMVHESPSRSGLIYSDNNNSDILYIIPLSKGGKANKIDLRSKTVVPWKFETEDGDPKITTRYRSESIARENVIFRKFQGTTDTRTIKQWFGWPGKEYEGTRKVVYYTGKWIILDKREGGAVELFRFDVNDAEDAMVLGDYDISQDGKWLVVKMYISHTSVFDLSDKESRYYIFNRKEAVAGNRQ